MNLTEWARLQGIHPQTAYRWFREGTLPVPAVRVNARSVPVAPDAVIAPGRQRRKPPGSAVTRALRQIAGPLVAAAPAGARVRTRLRVTAQDAAVLRAADRYRGSDG